VEQAFQACVKILKGCRALAQRWAPRRDRPATSGHLRVLDLELSLQCALSSTGSYNGGTALATEAP